MSAFCSQSSSPLCSPLSRRGFGCGSPVIPGSSNTARRPAPFAFRMPCSAKQVESEWLAHFVRAARARMDAIAAVERREDQIRIVRVLHDLIEIDHRIEWRRRANPAIDLVADARLRGVPSRVVLDRRAIVARDDRDADDLQAARLDPPDNVL